MSVPAKTDELLLGACTCIDLALGKRFFSNLAIDAPTTFAALFPESSNAQVTLSIYGALSVICEQIEIKKTEALALCRANMALLTKDDETVANLNHRLPSYSPLIAKIQSLMDISLLLVNETRFLRRTVQYNQFQHALAKMAREKSITLIFIRPEGASQ